MKFTTAYLKTKILKTALVILPLMLLGITCYSQSRLKLTIQEGDITLCLNKSQTLIISNALISKQEFEARLKGSLEREKWLQELWEASFKAMSKQTELIVNLEEQLVLEKNKFTAAQEQLALTEKVMKKGKRKSLLTGLVIGSIAGGIGVIVLSN